MAREVIIEGLRKLKNELVDDLKSVASSIYEIRDDLGAKKANVFFYTKVSRELPEDDTVTWSQILPTPNIVDLSQNLEQLEAGVLGDQQILLSSIPIERYQSTQLETISEDPNITKYWVIQESNRTRAYTTLSVKRELLSYSVHIVRYASINDNDLIIDN